MKETYRKLCEIESSIPMFSQAWWLDAVAGNEWSVVLEKKGDKVVGTLPFVERKRFGFTILAQPELTPSLGPWIRPTQKSYPKRLAFEKDVLGALVDKLPQYDYYGQTWHSSQTNWLPLYWRGFSQSTLYTYQLRDIGDKDKIWSGLQENIRREIRKARDRFGIKVRDCNSISEFLSINRMTFERQGRSQPYSDDIVERIDSAAAARGARDCLVAVDEEGSLHAGVYIVRHNDTAYYLMGGGDPKLRKSGATSLLLWEAINRQPLGVQVFDFEGSMIEPIERFFRAFGAVQTPYFEITHVKSKLFERLKTVRLLFKP